LIFNDNVNINNNNESNHYELILCLLIRIYNIARYLPFILFIAFLQSFYKMCGDRFIYLSMNKNCNDNNINNNEINGSNMKMTRNESNNQQSKKEIELFLNIYDNFTLLLFKKFIVIFLLCNCILITFFLMTIFNLLFYGNINIYIIKDETFLSHIIQSSVFFVVWLLLISTYLNNKTIINDYSSK